MCQCRHNVFKAGNDSNTGRSISTAVAVRGVSVAINFDMWLFVFRKPRNFSMGLRLFFLRIGAHRKFSRERI